MDGAALTARWLARTHYVGAGAIVWSAPGHLVGWLAEPAWAYVFFPLLAFGAWRGATVRVRETPDGLVVRNVVLSFVIPWPDVAGVRWDQLWAGPLRAFVVPLVGVRGRRRPVPVLAMACWQRPAKPDAARARGWLSTPLGPRAARWVER